MLQIWEIFLTRSDTPYHFPLTDSRLPFLLLLCFPFQSLLGKVVVTEVACWIFFCYIWASGNPL